MVQNFQNIQVWQDAVQFHEAIIPILLKFPKEEIYAMSSQLKRASLSISNNIAEGCGRESGKELRNFLNIAMGSVKETESMTVVAQKLGYINKEQYSDLIQKPKTKNRLTRVTCLQVLVPGAKRGGMSVEDQKREAPASLPQQWE